MTILPTIGILVVVSNDVLPQESHGNHTGSGVLCVLILNAVDEMKRIINAYTQCGRIANPTEPPPCVPDPLCCFR